MMTVLLLNPIGARRIPAGGRSVYAPKELLDAVRTGLTEIGTLKEIDALREIEANVTIGWKLGLAKEGESVSAVKLRADTFAKKIIAENESCVVAAPPFFMQYLIHAFERNGCNALRRENGSIRDGERVRITLKTDHCGGCQHNCLLSNPGCGVGRDKASRGY